MPEDLSVLTQQQSLWQQGPGQAQAFRARTVADRKQASSVCIPEQTRAEPVPRSCRRSDLQMLASLLIASMNSLCLHKGHRLLATSMTLMCSQHSPHTLCAQPSISACLCPCHAKHILEGDTHRTQTPYCMLDFVLPILPECAVIATEYLSLPLFLPQTF